MLDLFFRFPHPIRFLRRGLTGPYVDGYAQSLHDEGYCYLDGQRLLHAAHHLGEWAARRGVRLEALDERALARFGAHLPTCRCGRATRRPHRGLSQHRGGARRFLRYLRETGIAGPAPQPTPAPLVLEYASWLRDRRGLTESTIAGRLGVIESLLAATGQDPAALDAALVRRFVIEIVASRYASSPGHATTAVRSFLGFLGVHGRCPTTLVGAVPRIASQKHAQLPRYIAPDDVERVIAGVRRGGAAAAKDRDGATTARDHAMLLLLARLGLRSGDVRGLRIGDLDWEHGRLRLVGKSRRETHLPLPQEVGDAILTYLAKRPTAPTDHVFVRAPAPHRVLTCAGLYHAVEAAFIRAGVCTPSRGPHVLRHSLATRMLRDGATLDAIGAVLRHRQISTTAIYSKVDVELLRQVAQPWPEPEGAPC